ncbi:MAG TPA: PIN domain-containing protein [Opitutaceae bacterium]|nr:PIN domain-containing protein [Opitutaceae bacterium]
MAYTAIYDACVLYPAPLRDFLMQLALSDLYRAKWTDAIHDEWIGSLLERRPDLKREQLERTRELMNAHVRDCLVVGYEPLVGTIVLPDANDRHVVAAAIRARADVIVTFNLGDFPAEILSGYGLEAQHPDEFIAHLIDLAPQVVAQAARTCRARLKQPPKTVEEYLEALAAQRLPQTITLLRQMSGLI